MALLYVNGTEYIITQSVDGTAQRIYAPTTSSSGLEGVSMKKEITDEATKKFGVKSVDYIYCAVSHEANKVVVSPIMVFYTPDSTAEGPFQPFANASVNVYPSNVDFFIGLTGDMLNQPAGYAMITQPLHKDKDGNWVCTSLRPYWSYSDEGPVPVLTIDFHRDINTQVPEVIPGIKMLKLLEGGASGSSDQAVDSVARAAADQANLAAAANAQAIKMAKNLYVSR